jgi:hypothetical protein
MNDLVLRLRRWNSDRVPFARSTHPSKTKHSKRQPKEQFARQENGALIQQKGKHQPISLRLDLNLELKTPN